MPGSHTTEEITKVANEEVVKGRPASSLQDVKDAFQAQDSLRYIRNDTFVADPAKLLGRVYFERVGKGELIPFLTRVPAAVDESSRLTAPQVVSELLIDSKVGASAEFLAFASLSIGIEEVLEVRVLNNAAARAIDYGDAWDEAVQKWYDKPKCQELLDDPQIASVTVVTGVVQKYLLNKKYKKFEAGAKGGYAGLNVSGTLYTSSTESALDIVYGVDLVSFGHRTKPQDLRAAVAVADVMREKADVAAIGDKFVSMAKHRRGFG